jgi:hypothetical protein
MLQQAMERATRFQAFDVRTVQNLCHKMRLQRFGGDEPVPIGAVLSTLMARLEQGRVQNRNLQDYETVHPVAAEG